MIQHFWKLNSTFCRQPLRLQNHYPKFLLSIPKFENFDLLFVRDVTEYEYANEKFLVKLNEIFKSNSKGYKFSSHHHKTKIFVSRLDRTSRESFFMRKIFRGRSCWKFHHKCSSCPRVYPEIFGFFPHILREIFTNYFLIN